MKAHRVAVIGLASVSLIYAQQTVNLSGTLKNQFNNPMVNATVKLLGSSLTATTSNTGAFTLSGTATGISRGQPAHTPSSFNIIVRNGTYEISMKEPTTARVELFDARGMLIGTARFSQGTTSAVVPVTGKAINAFFMRVKVGNNIYTEKFINTPHSSSHSMIIGSRPSGNIRLAKETAAAGQLIILHGSFVYDTVNVTTLTGSVSVTVNIPDLSSKGPFTTLWPTGGEVLSSSQTIWLVVGLNLQHCDGNPEFYCQVSKDAGLRWNALGSMCTDDGERYPCMLEWTDQAFWNPNNIKAGTPGYFMHMDQGKKFGLCFYRCNLANFVGTQTVWMAESRYCGPTAVSDRFTVQ